MEARCGNWRLEGILAVGGIAEVWRGVAAALAEPPRAAIKILHSHLLRHDAVRAMFDVERELLQTLPRHPGLVHAFERGELHDRPWVAMNLVEGASLREHLDGPRIESGPPQPRRVAVDLALQLVARTCDAVIHLHEQGWVHGDVNPANLVVSPDLRSAVLCDLGVARRCGGAGPVQGTHAYMAPEQARGEPWTPATDVFALGVLLWELVEGRRLFHRGPSWLTTRAVLEEPVPPLGDPALDAIARRALAKDAAERLGDARALARALESYGVAISS
ncbi:MAG: serine/threonine-protein kinase [Kofleriaceae bacterium]